jgi:hypothetical protein
MTATARPDSIRIEDLGNPVLPPEVQAVVDQVGAHADALPWSLDAIAGAAQQQTGLTDFGNDLWREPFGVLVQSLATEAGLNAMGHVSCWNQILQFTKNRLLITKLLADHPEIHDIEVAAPIMIVGMPRTGTTHLHNLMASDPALRSLPYWESVYPVPGPDDAHAPGETDPRIARIDMAMAGQDLMVPHMKRMHEMTTWHVHEEIHLLAIAGSTMLFDCFAPIPTWRAYYKAQDQTPYYEELKTYLKVLSFLRPAGDRWVLKSPQHLEQLPVVAKVFPDATFVLTHRDPVSITASFCTMVAYTARLSQQRMDLARYGAYWGGIIEDFLTACDRDRDALPAAQSIDITFDEFMADDIAAVRRIYDLAGQPFTPEVQGHMESFMADHPRGKHGSIAYDLRDFGLDPAERRATFASYCTRFGVRAEYRS